MLWSIPGGFLVVIPRAEVCTWENAPVDEEYEQVIVHEGCEVPAERKPDSWGYLNGRLVAIDYGFSRLRSAGAAWPFMLGFAFTSANLVLGVEEALLAVEDRRVPALAKLVALELASACRASPTG